MAHNCCSSWILGYVTCRAQALNPDPRPARPRAPPGILCPIVSQLTASVLGAAALGKKESTHFRNPRPVMRTHLRTHTPVARVPPSSPRGLQLHAVGAVTTILARLGHRESICIRRRPRGDCIGPGGTLHVTPDRLLRNSKLLHPTNCVSQMQATTAQMHRGTSTKNGSTHEEARTPKIVELHQDA